MLRAVEESLLLVTVTVQLEGRECQIFVAKAREVLSCPSTEAVLSEAEKKTNKHLRVAIKSALLTVRS